MENKNKFKPFDRVIVKNKEKHSVWSCDMVSLATEDAIYTFCRGEIELRHYDILPFEGNFHLVGTSNMPEEEVELKNGEIVVVSDSIEYMLKGFGNIRIFRGIDCGFVRISSSQFYSYCIPFSKFNPNDLEETRKHILCVKDGKLVKAKL